MYKPIPFGLFGQLCGGDCTPLDSVFKLLCLIPFFLSGFAQSVSKLWYKWNVLKDYSEWLMSAGVFLGYLFQIMLLFVADVHFKEIQYYSIVGDSLLNYLNYFELAVFKWYICRHYLLPGLRGSKLPLPQYCFISMYYNYSLTNATLRKIFKNIFIIEDILILNFSVVEIRSHVAQDGLELLNHTASTLPPPPSARMM